MIGEPKARRSVGQARGAEGVVEPAGVDHQLHGVAKPTLEGPEGLGPEVFEVHLGGDHAAGPELVLEAAVAEPVGPPVDLAGSDEQTEPLGPVPAADRTGGEHEHVGVGAGAEPLLAPEAPGAIVEQVGLGPVGPHVGAALNLGEELRRGVVLAVDRPEQAGQPPLLLLGGAKLLHGPDGAGGAGQRAVVSALAHMRGEVEQGQDKAVGVGQVHVRRHDPALVDELAGAVVARVVGQPGHVPPDPVPGVEGREVGGEVVLANRLVERPGGHVPVAVERLDPLFPEVRPLHQAPEQEVGFVEVIGLGVEPAYEVVSSLIDELCHVVSLPHLDLRFHRGWWEEPGGREVRPPARAWA